MDSLNKWLEHWEPLWLFLLIGAEMLIGAASLYVLVREYIYDKEWNERKAARRKRHLQFEHLNDGEGK